MILIAECIIIQHYLDNTTKIIFVMYKNND